MFEHEGRFFILDWKSNHLGDTPTHYGQDAMAAAMRDQGYHLQYLLYLVALDRYLRHRLAGYDPEQHLGGAVYLFVRGVRPDWRDANGAPHRRLLPSPGDGDDRAPVVAVRPDGDHVVTDRADQLLADGFARHAVRWAGAEGASASRCGGRRDTPPRR